MNNEQKLQSPLKSKYTLITDPKILEKIKLEEDQEIKNGKESLYIAPNETEETYDQDIMSGRGNNLEKSRAEVSELRPIEVAVWFDDPNKNSSNSTLRVHRRIINGRHRYKTVPTWRRAYYDFSSFATKDNLFAPALEYNLAKGHFDMQKKATKGERSVWVQNMCELAMNLGVAVTDVCNWVVQKAITQGISSESAIRDVCDEKFKDKSQAQKKFGKTFEKTGKDTIEIKKLKKVAGEKYQQMEAEKLRLETTNTQLEKEIIGLKEENTKSVNIMEDLQQQLRLVANINHEEKCGKCGLITSIKVEASSGKVLVSQKK